MKPLLKWTGSKRQSAEAIGISMGKCDRVWHEPMVGSGAMFLYRRAAGQVGYAVLADINPKLINFHTVVRDQPEELLAELARLPFGPDHANHYYDHREEFNADCSPVRQAALLLFLNRTGFNGLYRENKSGGFNVPLGRYSNPQPPSAAHILQVSGMLQGVTLVCQPFQDTIRKAARGDQIYADPPYIPLSDTSSFTAYCKGGGFGPEQQQLLVHKLYAAASRGIKVGYSNSYTDEALGLVKRFGFGYRKIEVRRSGSAKSSGRGVVDELFALCTTDSIRISGIERMKGRTDNDHFALPC